MNQKILTPPISRLGGKSRLRKQIISEIPDHICYVEVFFGAGWVYFGKKVSKVEAINDIDGELVNLFKVIKHHAEELNRCLNFEIASRDRFCELKEADKKRMTDVHRAVRYLFLVNNSFAAKAGHFGYSALQGPKKKLNNADFLFQIKKRLENTYIENLDFNVLIDKYDKPTTFFYLDPPYFETSMDFNADITVQFGEEEHIALRNRCKTMSGKFLLSINNHPWIREIYSGFNIEEVELKYSCMNGKNQEAKELLISNYDLNMAKEIIAEERFEKIAKKKVH